MQIKTENQQIVFKIINDIIILSMIHAVNYHFAIYVYNLLLNLPIAIRLHYKKYNIYMFYICCNTNNSYYIVRLFKTNLFSKDR